jgi:hypothetical protein
MVIILMHYINLGKLFHRPVKINVENHFYGQQPKKRMGTLILTGEEPPSK